MSKKDEQIARMRGLMTYGIVTEEKKPKDIEYSIDAADGKTYSIIRENSKYYIKTAPKGKGLVLESYSFIGGWNNHKDYEYDSYNNALKQLELKVRSVNESYGDTSKVEVLNPNKKEDILAEASDSMKRELARFRELMNNVSNIMNESAISDTNTGNPEAPKTTSFNSKLGEPFNQTATAELDTDLKKTANSPEKQSEPFGDGKKAEVYKDAQYVPNNSVANKKPSGGKVVKVNEEFEETFEDCDCDYDRNNCNCNDWGSEGLNGVGVGSPDGHLMEDDDFEEEDAPIGFADIDNGLSETEEDFEFDNIDTDKEMDADDDIELDDVDDEEGLDDEPEDDEEGLDDELEDDEDFDELEDELSLLRQEIEDLKDEIAELKGEDDEDFDEEDDEDFDEDFDDEDEIDLDDEDFEDDEEDFEEEDDEDFDDEDDDLNESISKKKYLDRIVEDIVKDINGNEVDTDANIKSPIINFLNLNKDNPAKFPTEGTRQGSERIYATFNWLMKQLSRPKGFNEKYEDLNPYIYTITDAQGQTQTVKETMGVKNIIHAEPAEWKALSKEIKNALDKRKEESFSKEINGYQIDVIKNIRFRKIDETGRHFNITKEEEKDLRESFDKLFSIYKEVYGTENGFEGIVNSEPQLMYYELSSREITNLVYREAEEMQSVPEGDEISEQSPDYIQVNGTYYKKEYNIDEEYWDELIAQAQFIVDEVDDKIEEMNDIRNAQELEPIYEHILNFFYAMLSNIEFAHAALFNHEDKMIDNDEEEDEDLTATKKEKGKKSKKNSRLDALKFYDNDMDDVDNVGFKGKKKTDDEMDAAAYANAENFRESRRRNGRKLYENETRLHDFGRHPGYRKKPMSLPQTGADTEGQYRDWNDDSVYSEEPFGGKIGDSAPFETIVQQTVQTVMEQLKKKTLNERKVLKLPKQEPMVQEPMGDMNDMPPMDEPEENMGEQPFNGDDGSHLDGADENNQFDSKFDPGVEADEETDPKNFLQQLAGKVSQSLLKYNNENEGDEEGINKYVLQMIAKQAAKGMDDSDKKEVIKTIKSTNNESDDDMDLDADADTEEIENSGDIENKGDDEMEFQNESKIDRQMTLRFTKKHLVEGLGISDPKMERKKSDRPEMTIPNDAPTNRRSKAFKPRIFK